MTWARSRALAVLVPLTVLSACAAPAAPDTGAATSSILESASPSGGSTVRGPVDQLALRFSSPARLVEVTVTGADGVQTPMMVTAVGEVAAYSLPLPDLGPGAYTVGWRATAAGQVYQGSFRFTVR